MSTLDDATRPLGAAAREVPASEDRAGQTVGRYVVLRRIGRGGGGQVFAAFDTVLDRNVALKQLWDHGGQTQDIIREGRLLARLSHPSVVTLHDIAFKGETVFLAMELVDGEDFAAWSERQRGQDPRGIVRVIRDAGAGIAAAHRSGIVHGDVKPSNILVDREGRAHVTDFGVARLVDGGTRRTSDEDDDERNEPPATAGTPAYMAPEQHGGEAADPASDQYSFCLTAWEALTGNYPFSIDDMHRDLAATFSGGQEATGPLSTPLERLRDQKLAWRPPSSTRNLPARWLRALRRGLSVDPDDRFASMDELLAALGTPRRRWWPVIAGAAGAVGLLVAAWVWAREADERCTGAAAALGEAWNANTRAELETALLRTDVAFAPATWASVSEHIDAYASTWMDSYTEACRASAVRQEQSSELMDRRMACLQRARTDLAAATTVLRELDATSLSRAHRVLAGLPPLPRCADIEGLQRGAPAPAIGDAPVVQRARDAIASSKALRGAGRIPDAKGVIDAAADDALAGSYEPVHVELLVERGIVEEKSGEYEAAKASFSAAVTLATKLGMWERGLRAQRGLLYVVGHRLHNVGEARAYLPSIEGLVEREGNQTKDRAELAGDRALLAFEEADFERSVALEREALELFEEALGQRALSPMYTRGKLAGTLRNLGRYDEALAEYDVLIELQTQWLGPEHPDTLLTRCDRAQVRFRQGEYATAEAELRAALPPQEAILGRSHPEMLMYRATLAEVLNAQKRNEDAEREYRDALRHMGDGPGPVAELRNGLGNLLERMDRLDEAEEQLRKATDHFVATLGEDHPNVAISRANLANILARRGHNDEAEAENIKAQAALIKALGPDHPQVGLLHLNFGRFYKNLRRWDDARKQITAGISVLEKALDAEHPQLQGARELLQRLNEDEAADGGWK